MLAEDLLQDHLGLADIDSPKVRAYDFNGYYWNAGAADWNSADLLASYASVYIFGAFLARNFGGAGLVQSIMGNPYAGKQSITDALGALSNPEDFDDVFRAFPPALIYSDPAPVGVKIIETGDSRAVNSITYTLSAFDIYDYSSYWGGSGPVVITATSALPLRPYGVSIHSDPTWLGLSGDQSFTISLRAPSGSVSFHLMVR